MLHVVLHEVVQNSFFNMVQNSWLVSIAHDVFVFHEFLMLCVRSFVCVRSYVCLERGRGLAVL